MSLTKQLWIAIGVTMILAFAGSFAISTHSARVYFEEQLRLKNIDNANALAMTLSQVGTEQVMLELLIAAQFDTGHYQRIELLDPDGASMVRKTHAGPDGYSGPEWFARLAPLRVEPGVAQVQDGWLQLGTLYLESQTRFAQNALWSTTKELFLWLLAVAVACGALGSLALRFLTRPLDAVVDQAEAIGGRRFVTSHEPRTLEFARVVRAMNILSGRVRQTLEMEGGRLEEMRRQSQMDKLTGLANRDHFLDVLETLLRHEDRESAHALILVRISELGAINRTLGQLATDRLLRLVAETLARTLQDHGDKFMDSHIARIKGSDFALLLSDVSDLRQLSRDLCARLNALAHEHASRARLMFPMAAGSFRSGEERSAVMMRLDSLLATAEQRDQTSVEVCLDLDVDTIFRNPDEWREALNAAISTDAVQTKTFPVLAMDGTLVHDEAVMRLPLAGELRRAGSFIPWARRLGLLPGMDLAMLRRVCSDLRGARDHVGIAVNLSIETLRDAAARRMLTALIEEYTDEARRLWIELSERSAIKHLDEFQEFCAWVKPLGCRVGLERAGAGFASINRLQEIGLDYLKIDRSLGLDIFENATNQNFLRGLCILGHSIGLLLIAEGVQSEREISALKDLGVDAVTGPGAVSIRQRPRGRV